MITVIYDPIDGQICQDAKVEEFVLNCIEESKTTPEYFVRIGQDLILTYFRKALVEGKFEEMEVEFEGEVIPVNQYGGLKEWPKGLGDYLSNALMVIARGRRKSS